MAKDFAPLYFDRRGKPITRERWCVLVEMPGYSHLWTCTIDETVTVSTIWLGLNHSFDHGAPLIFETCVFEEVFDRIPGTSGGFARVLNRHRYSTEEDAHAGHLKLAAKYQAHFSDAKRIAQDATKEPA